MYNLYACAFMLYLTIEETLLLPRATSVLDIIMIKRIGKTLSNQGMRCLSSIERELSDMIEKL